MEEVLETKWLREHDINTNIKTELGVEKERISLEEVINYLIENISKENSFNQALWLIVEKMNMVQSLNMRKQ